MTANFTNFILWTQSKLPTDNDILIIDGKKSENRISSKEFDYITNFQKDEPNSWKPVLKNSIWNTSKSPILKGVSPKLEIYKNNDDNLLVKSHYTDTDDSQRRIAFIFCSKGNNYVLASRRLFLASQALGLTVNNIDLQIVKAFQFLKYIKVAVIIILLIILYYGLQKIIFD